MKAVMLYPDSMQTFSKKEKKMNITYCNKVNLKISRNGTFPYDSIELALHEQEWGWIIILRNIVYITSKLIRTYHCLMRIISVPCCLEGMRFNCSTTEFTWDQFCIFFFNKKENEIRKEMEVDFVLEGEKINKLFMPKILITWCTCIDITSAWSITRTCSNQQNIPSQLIEKKVIQR